MVMNDMNNESKYVCPDCIRDITGYVKYLMFKNTKQEVFSCACGSRIKYKFGLLEAKIEKHNN